MPELFDEHISTIWTIILNKHHEKEICAIQGRSNLIASSLCGSVCKHDPYIRFKQIIFKFGVHYYWRAWKQTKLYSQFIFNNSMLRFPPQTVAPLIYRTCTYGIANKTTFLNLSFTSNVIFLLVTVFKFCLWNFQTYEINIKKYKLFDLRFKFTLPY